MRLQEVEELYARELKARPSDRWLHLFVATYMRYIKRNHHMEHMHLSCANVRVRGVRSHAERV